MTTRREKCREFLKDSGVNNCSIIEDGDEGSFSMQGCDCCQTGPGNDVYECNGYNPTTKEIVELGDVCGGCIQYFYNDEMGDDVIDGRYWSQFGSGYIEFQLPKQAVEDCSHQGACDEDVEYWQKELKLNLDRVKMIKELKEYGFDWDAKDKTDVELEHYCIWIAAGDIKESEQWKESEQ